MRKYFDVKNWIWHNFWAFCQKNWPFLFIFWMWKRFFTCLDYFFALVLQSSEWWSPVNNLAGLGYCGEIMPLPLPMQWKIRATFRWYFKSVFINLRRLHHRLTETLNQGNWSLSIEWRLSCFIMCTICQGSNLFTWWLQNTRMLTVSMDCLLANPPQKCHHHKHKSHWAEKINPSQKSIPLLPVLYYKSICLDFVCLSYHQCDQIWQYFGL